MEVMIREVAWSNFYVLQRPGLGDNAGNGPTPTPKLKRKDFSTKHHDLKISPQLPKFLRPLDQGEQSLLGARFSCKLPSSVCPAHLASSQHQTLRILLSSCHLGPEVQALLLHYSQPLYSRLSLKAPCPPAISRMAPEYLRKHTKRFFQVSDI